jgi:hypothetical protein
LGVSLQNNISTLSAITAIRSASRVHFCAIIVPAARASAAAPATNLHVINKIAIGHEPQRSLKNRHLLYFRTRNLYVSTILFLGNRKKMAKTLGKHPVICRFH